MLSRKKRTAVVTIRLAPELRYLTELAARKHRRTLSSFIEWAIEDVLSRVSLSDDEPLSRESLWDIDESDRFITLARRHPELLTHSEQTLWKLIRRCRWLWSGQELQRDILRRHWGRLKNAVEGRGAVEAILEPPTGPPAIPSTDSAGLSASA